MVEEITVGTDDKKISALIVKNKNSDKNVSHFYNKGFNILSFDAFAHGKTYGKKSDFGYTNSKVLNDVILYIKNNYSPSQLGVYGVNQKLAAKKASAENKITKLEAMLLKAKEGKKKSYQSAINKLEKKIYQFDKRIEIIKEQKEDDQLKIAALKQVLETKKHALQEHDSKEAQIQIKKIQIEINILIEGREKSQLRMTLEKLSHTKANIENKLRSTYEEITKLKPLIYKEVSLTENINNQINNLELNNNLSGSQINELENLKNTQKQHLEFKTNKLHVLATKVSDKLEEIKQLVINKQNKLFNTGNENPKPKT
ncbi:hypothetical protein FQR65_LT16663 [Abscondita terminalis]|nr:hypothetical protein FQR65_LT16663 [Abscondita terminalis]